MIDTQLKIFKRYPLLNRCKFSYNDETLKENWRQQKQQKSLPRAHPRTMSSLLPPCPQSPRGDHVENSLLGNWSLLLLIGGVLKTKKLQASPDMCVASTTQKGTPQLSPSDIDFTKTAACETDPKK